MAKAASKPITKKDSSPKIKEFTEEELSQLRTQFDMIDLDGNGTLDRDEMIHHARLYSIDENFVDLAFRMYDGDQDNALTWDEFLEFHRFARNFSKCPDPFYAKMFAVMDADKDGALKPPEFQELCRLLGHEMSDEQAVDIVKSMDSRGAGALLQADLIRWLHKKG
jgi:Ca2+-binding EF-hand superfamily protein